MSLDARLAQAAAFIQAEVHADIGADHALLPIELLRSGRADRVIVVERHRGPVEVARAALSPFPARAEVRWGDGFGPIQADEVGSASLTGMGARTIVGILKRAGWLPEALVLQPNDSAEPIRRWAGAHGYHLVSEALAGGFWTYGVLRLEQGRGEDTAYTGLPVDAARRFGPHLLRRRDSLLHRELERQVARLTPLARHGRPEVIHGLILVRQALELF